MTLRQLLPALVVVLFLTGSNGQAADDPSPAYLAFDGNREPFPYDWGSYPRGFTKVGSKVFFLAEQAGTGGGKTPWVPRWVPDHHEGELWVTDGTTEGTVFVKDIWPGTWPSAVRSIVELNGTAYFTASDRHGGVGLWRSDGTETGTVLLRSFVEMDQEQGFDDQRLVVAGDRLFFSADDGVTGLELWTSDGTASATELVLDLRPGLDPYGRPNSGVPEGNEYAVAGSRLLVNMYGGPNGEGELWASDGTPAGTVRLHPRWGRNFAEHGGVVYFASFDDALGWELWRTDGTPAGTELVHSLAPARDVDRIVSNGRDKLFLAIDDGVHGTEPWVTDGTLEGFGLLKDIHPGSEFKERGWVYWKPVVNIDGVTFFVGDDGVHRHSLWRSDGTEAGTTMVKDAMFVHSDRPEFVVIDGILYFEGSDPGMGSELWRSDGTEEGTYEVTNIGTDPAFGSRPDHLEAFDGALIFSASGPEGREVWTSDGTTAGTKLLKDIVSQAGASYWPRLMIEFDGALYFNARTEETGRVEFLKSDGTREGTTVVTFEASTPTSPFVSPFGELNGDLYVWGNGSSTPGALWKTDGGDGGFEEVHPLPEPELKTSRMVTRIGDSFFFAATTDEHGRELWKTDGTPEGTKLVKDVVPGPRGSLFSNFQDPWSAAAVGDRLFFIVRRNEIWKTDGTEAGTVLVKKVPEVEAYDGYGLPLAEHLVEFQGALYFVANKLELWRSDGTEAGTVQVDSLPRGDNWASGGRGIQELTSFDGQLYFSALRWWDDYRNLDGKGRELWVSDGTPGSLRLLKDIRPGPGWGHPFNFTPVGDRLVFIANDGIHGEELWVTDGTEEGTRLVANVAPGSGGSQEPAEWNWGHQPLRNEFAVLDSTLYFSATTKEHGMELWAVPLAALKDADLDGLEDDDERELGTDLWDPDSDGDGLPDGREVNELGTDPLNGDSDGDGLPDGLEVLELGSDPLSTDSDGDGFKDGLEVEAGSDPADGEVVPLALTRTQQRCVNQQNKNVAALTRARGDQIADCVRFYQDEKRVGSALVCFDAAEFGNFERRAARLASREYTLCREPKPPFGYVPTDTVIPAAWGGPMTLAEDLFGSNADGALVQGDRHAATCQQGVLRHSQRFFDTLWQETRRTKRQVLRGRLARTSILPPVAASELGELLKTWLQLDPRGRLARRTDVLANWIPRACRDQRSGAPLQLDLLFPGVCRKAESFPACLVERVRCRFCEQLNTTDGLMLDCDEFDDGVANNESCALPAP